MTQQLFLSGTHNPDAKVAIAILNYNGLQHLQQFLPSVLNISYKDCNIYVIDNASNDGSLAWLSQTHEEVTIIQTGANLGFAEGYNAGISKLSEPYVLIINSDVEVDPGFLEPLVNRLESDSNIAAVQPKILAYNNKQFFEHAGAAGGMMDVLGYSFCRGRLFNKVEQDFGQYDKPGNIFWASGACSLYRRDAYVSCGGMYGWFFMHFEEIDLCWRLQSDGYKIYYEPSSKVYHLGGGSLSYNNPQKTFLNFRNNMVMVVRNSPLSYLIWWFPLRTILDLVAALTFLVQSKSKHALAVLKAFSATISWMFSTKQNRRVKRKASLPALNATYKGSILYNKVTPGNKS